MPEFDEAGIGVAARAMFDFHHGSAADYDPNFAWDDLDDWARDYWQQLAEAALSRCPSPVSGTEPPPIDEDAAYWRQKYEEALHLADPVKIMLGVERILLDDGREFVLAPVSGTEPDTATETKLVEAAQAVADVHQELIRAVTPGDPEFLHAQGPNAIPDERDRYDALFSRWHSTTRALGAALAGFSVDAGKAREER